MGTLLALTCYDEAGDMLGRGGGHVKEPGQFGDVVKVEGIGAVKDPSCCVVDLVTDS